MEQQQQALDLRLRQGAAARQPLGTPADAHRLEQLHLQQRMEQQQLELQQLQRDRASRHNTSALPPEIVDRQLERSRDLFAQERELQNQRFELERQRLLQSMPRQPLQPPIGSGQLNLP